MASQVPKQGALFVSYFFWNMLEESVETAKTKSIPSSAFLLAMHPVSYLVTFATH